MSLLSLVRDPLDYFRPSLLLDQHFGMGLDENDFLEPCLPRRIRKRFLTAAPYYPRNWHSLASQKDKCSTLSMDKNKFQVSLDVQQFSPEEISIRTSGDTITIEGKHEEKEDEHGLISRHFVRKYTLPEGHDINLVQSKLSSDGILTITAPKCRDEKLEEREIPIALTGEPSKPSIEVGEDEQDKKCEKRQEQKKKK